MSKYSIGINALGKRIKTFYEVIRGKTRPQQETALRAALNQIQNIMYKRIKRLKAYEKKHGITSPALRRLRESGYGNGVSLRGANLDKMQTQYKAFTAFLQDDTSTIKGLQKRLKGIEKDLSNVGYKPENGKHITGEEYEKFRKLADKFYSETTKALYYRQSGYMTQAELKSTANAFIADIMDGGGTIDEMLDRAEEYIDALTEDGLPEIEWIGTKENPFGKMKL